MITDNNPSVTTPGTTGKLPRRKRPASSGEGDHYEIVVKGHLEEHWSEWLGDLRISHTAQGNSLLSGFICDQAALYGVLLKVRDLGLPLLSLARIEVEDIKETLDQKG